LELGLPSSLGAEYTRSQSVETASIDDDFNFVYAGRSDNNDDDDQVSIWSIFFRAKSLMTNFYLRIYDLIFPVL
jgi:hypothetical protein